MIVIHGSEVFDELVDISFRIALDDEDLARRFLDACDETFRFLAANKNIGKTRNFGNPLLGEIRMWRIKRFDNYLIFNRPFATGVEILHVVHGARNYDLLFEENDAE